MSDRLLNDDDLGLLFLTHRAIREDLDVLPVAQHHGGEDEWREGARRTSLRELSLVLPWVFDAADARERAMLDSVLPWPVKLLYRVSWRRSYDRLVRPVRMREREAA